MALVAKPRQLARTMPVVWFQVTRQISFLEAARVAGMIVVPFSRVGWCAAPAAVRAPDRHGGILGFLV